MDQTDCISAQTYDQHCDHAHLAPDLSIMLSVEAPTLMHLTAAVSYVILTGHTPMTIHVLSMMLNYPFSSLVLMLNCINLVLNMTLNCSNLSLT